MVTCTYKGSVMIAVPEMVEQLRGRIRSVEKSRRGVGDAGVSTGWPPLDALLPGGGLRRGSLVEWLAAGPGSGAALLAWGAAQQAAQEGGAIVVLDRRREVYPPALAAWGVELERVIFVQPQNARDEGWAWDQALRCPGVAAVWGWVDQVDGRLFRRWQLSAEAGGCLGLLIRPGGVRTQPTWADVRWWVEPQNASAGRRWRVDLLRCRAAGASGSVEFVLDEWTGQLRELAAKMGPAAKTESRTGTGTACAERNQPQFWSPIEEEPRHVTHPRPLAAQLARATARPRTTGIGSMRHRAV
jgi:protein ImuA